MAAPFKAVLKFTAQDGTTHQYPCTVSDVNAAQYVFPDGEGNVVLPSNHGTMFLTDVILSAAGTDTTTASLFVNGNSTNVLIMNAANVATNLSRQFMGAPVAIAAGARLKITQNT